MSKLVDLGEEGCAPVDPIWHVERPVGTERKEVVRRDRLCLAGPLQHEQLGQDTNRLEVDGERPKNLHGRAADTGQCCSNDRRSAGTHKW